MTLYSLKGKVALITGAGAGIGAVIARTYSEAGATVVLVDRDEQALGQTAKSLESDGRSCASFGCDVTKSADIEACGTEVLRRFKRVDILVNNAGGSGPTPALDIETIDEDVWDHVIALNLKSAFLFSRVFIPRMRTNGFGRVINMSSTLRDGLAGPLNTVNARLPYSTSKAAIIGFTKQLAKDVARYGVTVNALAPGLIHATPDARIAQKYSSLDDSGKKAMMSAIPAGRPGTGLEVANAALFLASEASSYINGDTLVIAGGI